jgi:hypothetical protein
MNPRDVEDLYGLWPMRQGILFDSLQLPETEGLYFLQFEYVFHGNLIISSFKRAWQQGLARHYVANLWY